MASVDVVSSLDSQARPLANFSPCIWRDRFNSFTIDNEIWEAYSREIDSLKDDAKSMLVDSESKWAVKLNFINTIERLGLGYHFQEEIEGQLEKMFDTHFKFEVDQDFDLFTTSLQFRIFRQHGYNISTDVFNKFKDGSGKFSEAITNDPLGMLSLYEAAHLRTHGDVVLDEALDFTTSHLKSIAASLESCLAKQVCCALEQPLHKGIPRLEARKFISFYEKDPCKNDSLLKLAKLDFNLIQMLHKQELSVLLRWWADLDISSKLPFARNRLVECFFWAVSVFYEPQYSLTRNMYTKISIILTITDDMYDAYATIDELKLYSDAMERLDANNIDVLPDYMKISYALHQSVYHEFEEEMTKQGRSYSISYLKESFKEVVRAYYIEAKWRSKKYVPSFEEEYYANALSSSALCVVGITAIMGMPREIVTAQTFEWASNKSKSVIATEITARLLNDIVGYQENNKRDHVATSIDCYMKEHGVSKEEATAELFRKVEDAWRDINGECLRPTPVSIHTITRYLNEMRMTDVSYKIGDGFTHPDKHLKREITAMLIDPIPI